MTSDQSKHLPAVFAKFFAPVDGDLIHDLIIQYDKNYAELVAIRDRLKDNYNLLSYFFNDTQAKIHLRLGGEYSHATEISRMFDLDRAKKNIAADYWTRTINLTDILECLPENRRAEWDKMINERKTPDFTEDNVRTTLSDLLEQRYLFVGEQVDGAFQKLSKQHVTNRPEGFYKRMIFTNALWNVGYINDLRKTIARFMSWELPDRDHTRRLLEKCKTATGTWHEIDGGALKIRLYLNGNAHLEVHPDMAWRLNCILAMVHPNIIPDPYRQAPQKKQRTIEPLIQQLIPLEVINQLMQSQRSVDRKVFKFNEGSSACLIQKRAIQVLNAIGGVEVKGIYPVEVRFDYDYKEVLLKICLNRAIPDQKSHQFYPTEQSLALKAIAVAEIGPDDECLEPNAGQGGIADFLPKERTTCIEVADLYCQVLAAKDHHVVNADFIAWAKTCDRLFDRIVMNPPFNQKQWLSHTIAATGLLKQGGIAVAILPTSALNMPTIPGTSMTFSDPIENQFADTSISVVIVKIAKI